MSWSYTGPDPGLSLFTACLEAGAPMQFTPGMRVLEIGCCEADWLHLAAAAWPACSFVGVDWRAPDVIDTKGRVERKKANALEPDLFPAASFDAVVSLSAIEHFGLGHYREDPLDPDGDTHIMANCRRWLRPGGSMYFDVPFDPTRYYVQGTECRVYDWPALHARVLAAWSGPLLWAGYAEAGAAGTLVVKPSAPVQPFHYIALVLGNRSTLTPQDSGSSL